MGEKRPLPSRSPLSSRKQVCRKTGKHSCLCSTEHTGVMNSRGGERSGKPLGRWVLKGQLEFTQTEKGTRALFLAHSEVVPMFHLCYRSKWRVFPHFPREALVMQTQPMRTKLHSKSTDLVTFHPRFQKSNQ